MINGGILEELLMKAESLGNAIKDTQEYINYMKISEKLQGLEYESRIARRFSELSDYIYTKEKAAEDIEPHIADEYEAIVMKISGNELLKEYIKYEAEYVQILEKVREILV